MIAANGSCSGGWVLQAEIHTRLPNLSPLLSSFQSLLLIYCEQLIRKFLIRLSLYCSCRLSSLPFLIAFVSPQKGKGNINRTNPDLSLSENATVYACDGVRLWCKSPLPRPSSSYFCLPPCSCLSRARLAGAGHTDIQFHHRQQYSLSLSLLHSLTCNVLTKRQSREIVRGVVLEKRHAFNMDMGSYSQRLGFTERQCLCRRLFGLPFGHNSLHSNSPTTVHNGIVRHSMTD